MEFADNETGKMRHINKKQCACIVGNFAKFFEIDRSRIGTGACQDHLGIVLVGKLAELCRQGMESEWEFTEWAHGTTGRPMGKAYQSWSAASYIAAYLRLQGETIVEVPTDVPDEVRQREESHLPAAVTDITLDLDRGDEPAPSSRSE